jgi:hypothetical protein
LCWRKWVLWCGGHHANPFYPSENLAIEHLMYLIRLNVSYSVLNTHKSMLMQTLPYFGITGVINQIWFQVLWKGILTLNLTSRYNPCE